MGISELDKLVIASTVRYVGAYAFADENSSCYINEAYIGDNIEYVANDGLGLWNVGATHITGDITKIFDITATSRDSIGLINYANEIYVNGELLTDLVVPEGVTRINDYILYDYDLNSLTLPASIEYIGESAFGNIGTVYYDGTREEWQNVSVNSGYITGSNVYYYSETDPGAYGNYWHYENGVPTLWSEFVPSEGLEITDGMITGIGTCTDTVLMLDMPVANNAFSGNTTITDVIFGGGVTSIGNRAFA